MNHALHMIGNDPHKRDIRIICSPDDGRTWSKPVTLFDDSRYHGSATPVHVKDGFVYRAFEDMNRGSASWRPVRRGRWLRSAQRGNPGRFIAASVSMEARLT